MEKDASDAKTKVMEMVKDLHVAMLSTRGPDGKFHSRPMAVSDATFQGSLYFLTDVGSGKIHDLATYPETIVTFADSGQQKYVAMRGIGAITQDKAAIKDHWTAAARAWFPNGVDDPGIALITVEIEEAEYWDAPSGKMVVLYAYAKAFVTGKRPGNVGENARVDMT
ncbi:MAG TPA: pyridoxamine 5'-phosphate oxidase family protein [Lichenihabitans sp.]|nr:pyridoxamine 5'-phosphate oxidase family protein [Lichenihabitans sp.]